MREKSFNAEARGTEEESEHFLFPSTLFAERPAHRVQTILGSCVAVCLYDTKLGFGGINHYMLPWWNGKGIPSAKYGDVAIDLLLKRMESLGASQHNLVAKIFGGGSQHFQAGNSVGERNIQTAEKLLMKYGIAVAGRNTGGELGRKIIFHTATGKVFMKFLDSTS